MKKPVILIKGSAMHKALRYFFGISVKTGFSVGLPTPMRCLNAATGLANRIVLIRLIRRTSRHSLLATISLPHGNLAQNGNIALVTRIPPLKTRESSSIRGMEGLSTSPFMLKRIPTGYRLTTDWTCASVKSSNSQDGNSGSSWNS